MYTRAKGSNAEVKIQCPELISLLKRVVNNWQSLMLPPEDATLYSDVLNSFTKIVEAAFCSFSL